MPKTPLVYVIVVNYNGTDYLKGCLSTLEQQTYPNFRIIVVDNASTEESANFISKNFPNLTLIASKENLGFTGGNNLAMKHALQQEADYVFLVNNDTESPKDLLEHLVRTCQRDKTIGIATPAVFDLAEKNRVQEMGMAADKFAYPLALKQDKESCIFFVSGCSMLIKARLLKQVGFFDDSYFMFVEDLDFCWRAQLSGYRPVVDRGARIFHASGASLAGGVAKNATYSTNVRRIFYREKNTLRTLIKNYATKNAAVVIPFYMGLLTFESLLWLCLGKLDTTKMILKAILWNLQVFPDTMKQRVKVQSIRKVDDKEITSRMMGGYCKLAVFRRVGVPQFTNTKN